MAIKPVYKDGQAYEINKDITPVEFLKNRNEYTQENGDPVSEAQIKWAERFLSDKEYDEIYYDENSSKERGKSAMSLDLDGDGKDDIQKNSDGSTNTGEGAGSAVATVGTAVSTATVATICAGAMSTKLAANINGFVALVAAIAINVGAAMALVFSFANMFDNGYDIRKKFSDATSGNADTLDSQNDLLVENMDAMNEDAALYEEQTTEYTEMAAASTNRAAELKIEMADAQAAGDIEKVSELREEINGLEEDDMGDMEDGLQETRDRMDEYGASSLEADGMITNATTIAQFLDVGKPLGKLALINATLLTAATTVLGLCVAFSAIPKIWVGPVPADEPSGLAGSLLFGAAAAMMGMAAGKMFKNMSDENKYGENGDVMHEHINDLQDMVGQHSDYMEETVGSFDELDENMETTQEEIAENATKAVEDKTGDKEKVRVGGAKEKDEDFKKKHKNGGTVEPTHKKPEKNDGKK